MNKASVHQAIQVRRLLVKLKERLIVQVILIWLLIGENHSQARLHLVLSKLLLEALQIEWISNEIIIDFDKELMTFQRAEPFDPANLSILDSGIV